MVIQLRCVGMLQHFAYLKQHELAIRSNCALELLLPLLLLLLLLLLLSTCTVSFVVAVSVELV